MPVSQVTSLCATRQQAALAIGAVVEVLGNRAAREGQDGGSDGERFWCATGTMNHPAAAKWSKTRKPPRLAGSIMGRDGELTGEVRGRLGRIGRGVQAREVLAVQKTAGKLASTIDRHGADIRSSSGADSLSQGPARLGRQESRNTAPSSTNSDGAP